MPDSALALQSLKLGEWLLANNATITTAESCTGGWIAKVLTDVSGCSAWFKQGFVTYSELAKQQQLGVSARSISTDGVVSETVVKQMAFGARERAKAVHAIAVSGIAGPAGGSLDNPVGTVWFGYAREGKPAIATRQHFVGERDTIRRQAVAFALQWLLQLVAEK